jgi:hypothetical protein
VKLFKRNASAVASVLLAARLNLRQTHPSFQKISVRSLRTIGEKQEKVADEATVALLTKLPLNSDVEKAKAAFGQAQSVEEKFHHDFDGVNFTMR